VATISRLLKIIGLFCKRAVQKRLYSAEETYNLKEPTNRSHPIRVLYTHITKTHYAYEFYIHMLQKLITQMIYINTCVTYMNTYVAYIVIHYAYECYIHTSPQLITQMTYTNAYVLYINAYVTYIVIYIYIYIIYTYNSLRKWHI